MNDVLFSVITPVYNREDSIARCIDSVIKQLNNQLLIEHIIVDDGSTDNTASIVQKYVESFQHIHFIEFSENRGTNAARNAAINKAVGKYCIILDSDDYFVDNALLTINRVISGHSYNYYMFAPDDMITKYNSNVFLRGFQKELLFEDFLLNRVGGDFVHVMPTNIIKDFPFDEELRIYEGVFFLRFYKEVRKMLFTKDIVTIRERSRKDSVTRQTFRTEKKKVYKNILANELCVKWFRDDYISVNALDSLVGIYKGLVENYILLSDYENARVNINQIKLLGQSLSFKLFFLYNFKMGKIYYLCLKLYLILKYSVFNKTLK